MKLKYLINVFNVWPAFLLPVFYNDQKFFFQKIQSKYNYIDSFVEADLKCFEESYYFEVKKEIGAAVNESAIYAIGFNKSDFIYGDSETIIDDYRENFIKYEQDEYFKKTIISFMNKYNNGVMISNHAQNITINSNFNIKYFKITDIQKKQYFENDYGVLYCVKNLTFATIDDIYLFKNLIDNNFLNITCNVLYQKHNSDVFMYLSFQKQANIIDFVIKHQPREYQDREYQAREYFKRKYNLFFGNMSTYLWNIESINIVLKDNIIKSNLFNRLYGNYNYNHLPIRRYLEKNIQDILTEWHLKLNGSILELSKEINTKENFDDFINDLLLGAEQEESELYLLNVILLSKKVKTNMIVAQNYFNKKVYNFKIKEGSVSVLDIIDFLELLYEEHKKRFTIIISENEIFYNQQFYSWIEDNHDRFSVKSLPSLLGVSI